jgi:phage-related protein
MPSIESACHELRINDRDQTWRIVHGVEADAIVVLEVFSKKTARRRRRYWRRAGSGYGSTGEMPKVNDDG